jgi:hypothetical protein
VGVPVVEISYIYSPYLVACSKYNGDRGHFRDDLERYEHPSFRDRFLENTAVIERQLKC